MTLTRVDQREEASKPDPGGHLASGRSRGDQQDAQGGKTWGEGEGGHQILKMGFDQNRNGNAKERNVTTRASVMPGHEMGQFPHQQIFVGSHVLKPPAGHPYQKLYHHGFVSHPPNMTVSSSYLPYLPHQPLYKGKPVPRSSMFVQQQQGRQSWLQTHGNMEGVRAHERVPLSQHLAFPPPYHLVRPNPLSLQPALATQCAQATPDSQYS